jgi:hydrogenase maturation protease
MKTLVLGLGNTLLSDEGLGVRLLDRLAAQFLPDGVELLDGGTLSFTLAVPIEAAEALIVVDAANLQAEPGHWRLFEGEAMDHFLLHPRRASVHEVGLTDLRSIALLAGHWPSYRALLAMQPLNLDWGESLSPAVEAALGPACAALRGLIDRWEGEANLTPTLVTPVQAGVQIVRTPGFRPAPE